MDFSESNYSDKVHVFMKIIFFFLYNLYVIILYADFYSTGRKRMRISEDKGYANTIKAYSSGECREADYLQDLESGKYGSVTNDIKKLLERGMDFLKPKYARHPDLLYRCHDKSSINEATNQLPVFVKLDDDCDPRGMRQAPVVIIDSDEDEPVNQNSSHQYQGVLLPMPVSGPLMLDPVVICLLFHIIVK